MPELLIIHSTKSGKGDLEQKKLLFREMVEAALGKESPDGNFKLEFTDSLETLESIIETMINERTPRVAVNGGDGFASLFFNMFDALKRKLERNDYEPDILFLKGGTGNAISYCAEFKTPAAALKNLADGNYQTERLTLLEVRAGDRRELAHFTSFGADGEIIEIYEAQKLKGLLGYIWAVIKYSMGRKLYNPIFSRRDANYTLNISSGGEHIHQGRHEGGGISAIPYIGYGFRPYPLAVRGNAHIRFVLFGAYLMPTIFKFTNWVFTHRPNRIIYDYDVDRNMELDFSFDRALRIQISGDVLDIKHSRVRVGFDKSRGLNIVKKK